MPQQTEVLQTKKKAKADRFGGRTDDSSREFYQTYTWRKFRKRVMKTLRKQDEARVHDLYADMPNTSFSSLINWINNSHPLCTHCIEHGHIRPAPVADHIKRIRNGGDALNPNNIEPLCTFHHNRKSGKEAHE